MKQQNEGSWKNRWRKQWLEARLELLMQIGEAEGLSNRLADLMDSIEMQAALVRLYARLADKATDEPP